MAQQNETYERLTESIVQSLEAAAANGTAAPWQKPWRESGVTPYNPITGTEYSGVNRIILMLAGGGAFATFKQIAEKKGKVRKGAKGIQVCYYGTSVKAEENENGEESRHSFRFLRTYYVFRWDDVEGLDNPKPRGLWESTVPEIERCEAIVAGYRARASAPGFAFDSHNGAYYVPMSDIIHMPNRNYFTSSESYYDTLYHEMAHSTGHRSRLARLDPVQSVIKCGDEYGREELVAELTSCFLAHEAQIDLPIRANQEAYLRSWLRTIKQEPRLLVSSASAAQKAADYILSR